MEKRMITTEYTEEDVRIEGTLRPQYLTDYIGQKKAKEKLKIYWSPECQNKVISTIKHIEDNKDVNLIKNKINPI